MSEPIPIGALLESMDLRRRGGPDEPPPLIPTAPILTLAGVPRRFEGHRLTTFQAERPDQKQAVAAARRVLDDHRGMVLTGPVGTGKTHLAVGIMAELADQRRLVDEFGRLRAYFVVVPELLDAIRLTFQRDVEDPLDRLLSVPLLILDDLGAEKPTEWVVNRLYVLVNHRYNERRVTVATSNYSLNELVDRGYERTVSRLCEGASVVALDGPDERMADHAAP